MVWLHAKLKEIKERHRKMVEMCILRTRMNYSSEIRQLQVALAAAHPLLEVETSERVQPSRRGGIAINILGQQNIGSPGVAAGGGNGEPGSFHVNQNIGINNNEPTSSGSSEESTTTTTTEAANTKPPES